MAFCFLSLKHRQQKIKIQEKRMSALLEQVQSKAKSWINSPVIDDQTKALVRSLLDKQESKELIDSFLQGP